MPAHFKVARVQKRGQVTIPIEVRQKLHIEEGDLVAFIETKEGFVLSPQEVVSADTLNRVESLLQQQGVELGEVFAFGERLAQGKVGDGQSLVPASTPTDGGQMTDKPGVVERTAGLFHRQDKQDREIDFEEARQDFIESIARQAAIQDTESQG